MKHYSVTAYGCLGSSERLDKDKVFSESKFCIAMENSNAPYYVSEKVRGCFDRPCLLLCPGYDSLDELSSFHFSHSISHAILA